LDRIKEDVTLLLESATTKISCHELTHFLAQKYNFSNRLAARLIHDLVKDGSFLFVYDCGQNFLEKNYANGFCLSDNVMVVKPGTENHKEKGTVIIKLMPGAAFGDCRHPTTRLSVRAVDKIFSEKILSPGAKTALDIGTGSGILAITAAALGMERVLALDIDPCARKEARENIAENNLQDRVTVSALTVDKTEGRFNLIISNLRSPTLIRYAETISEKTAEKGVAVLSGVKEEEYDPLLAVYKKTFDCLWKQTEGGWCATVLLKKG
jgi:ribosomal protein L11 methyltransferase